MSARKYGCMFKARVINGMQRVMHYIEFLF